jgi:hypothetical protein
MPLQMDEREKVGAMQCAEFIAHTIKFINGNSSADDERKQYQNVESRGVYVAGIDKFAENLLEKIQYQVLASRNV